MARKANRCVWVCPLPFAKQNHQRKCSNQRENVSKAAAPGDLWGWLSTLEISSCLDYTVCCVKIPFHSVLLGNFLSSHLKMARRFSEMTHRWCAFLAWRISSHRKCGSTAVTETFIFSLRWFSMTVLVTVIYRELQTTSCLLWPNKCSVSTLFTVGLLIKVWSGCQITEGLLRDSFAPLLCYNPLAAETAKARGPRVSIKSFSHWEM